MVVYELGLWDEVASQLEGWNFATTYTVAQGRPKFPGYGNPGSCRWEQAPG